jgi:hypothetical protein
MENFTQGENSENILTREDILREMSRFIEGVDVSRELSDNQGIYLLEIVTPGERPGETTEYQYFRKGKFPNHIQSSETCIYKVYFEDGIPVSSETLWNSKA